MKANKILMLIQTIGMYVSQMSILALFIIIDVNINTERVNAIKEHLGDSYFICLGIILLVSLINIVVAISSLRKPATDISKYVANIKTAQIPWYIINYILTVLVFIGFLNPFLFFISPIYLMLSVLFTYLFMFSTSLPLFLSNIRLIKNDKSVSTVLNILASISLFFFVFDVFGSLYLYLSKAEKEKKKKKEDLAQKLDEYERTN